MHIMDNTKKIVTIIGLGFEILGVAGYLLIIWLINIFDSIPGVSAELELMTLDEIATMNQFLGFLVNALTVALVIVSLVLLINLFLFSKLIGGKYTDEQAKRVYLYQAIWGGINLLSNQITGILYLVSGVGGYNGQKEETDIREGI